MSDDSLAVVHDIPGRLRVRLPARARSAGLMEAIGALPGIVSCVWSDRTRSLLVRYRPEEASSQALVGAIAAHVGILNPPAAPGPPESPASPALIDAVTRTVSALNLALGRLTGGVADLRTLLPLALVAWAAREILRGRAGPIAWSAALWYAHGLFRDYGLGARDRGADGD
jgi:hypothetical protein